MRTGFTHNGDFNREGVKCGWVGSKVLSFFVKIHIMFVFKLVVFTCMSGARALKMDLRTTCKPGWGDPVLVD